MSTKMERAIGRIERKGEGGEDEEDMENEKQKETRAKGERIRRENKRERGRERKRRFEECDGLRTEMRSWGVTRTTCSPIVDSKCVNT